MQICTDNIVIAKLAFWPISPPEPDIEIIERQVILKVRVLPVFFSIFLAGCTCQVKIPNKTYAVQDRGQIAIYDHPIELRFSKPKNAGDSLVIYATGDGGWRGLDVEIFDWISGWGYPVVGFSSKSYLKHLEYIGNTTTPRRLVRDFEEIIQFAEQKLGMPKSTRIILAGLSRGAGLTIVAAGEGELKPNLAGVVAVALTKDEEHVLHYRRRTRSQTNQPDRELVEIQTYEYLPRIDSVRVGVIQSTHDSYLPAADARILFGPDTETKRLIAVNAKNHRFTGGCLNLYTELESTLDWILKLTVHDK